MFYISTGDLFSCLSYRNPWKASVMAVTKGFISCVVLLCLFRIPNSAFGKEVTPSVQIGGSEIIGRFSDVAFKDDSKRVKLFLGIPYAEPPVGKYRFRKSERLASLPDVVTATSYGPGCLQVPGGVLPFDMVPGNQSENCLFLNVFVPDAASDKGEGHAVMVFIHGGGFIVGVGETGAQYPAAYGNVILVTINYRLGVFGFLGTGDGDAPGNLGLWDQHMALQWVHENIGAFGGDNTRVTIFGESAGAISVLYQAMFPPNKGLFQRVIAQSGTPAMKFLFHYEPLKFAKHFAGLLACDKGGPDEIVACLRSKSAEEIINKQNELYLGGTRLEELGFVPFLDNDFIKIDVLNIVDLTENDESEILAFYRSLDIINGVNSAEGIITFDPQYIPLIENVETFLPTRQQMDSEGIPRVLNNHYGAMTHDVLLRMVAALYTDWSNPNSPETMRQQLMKLNGDVIFVVPAVQFSRLHVNSSKQQTVNSYMYYLKANPRDPILPRFSWAKGANHADDLSYVFHDHVLIHDKEEISFTDSEYELSLDMMRYWANFAKTGNPNKPEQVKTAWERYDLEEQQYLEIDRHMSAGNAKKYFYAEEAEFWLKTLPVLRKSLSLRKSPGLNKDSHGACSADGECESP